MPYKILFSSRHGAIRCRNLIDMLGRHYIVETSNENLTYEFLRCYDVAVLPTLEEPVKTEEHESIGRALWEGTRILMECLPQGAKGYENFIKASRDNRGHSLVEDISGKTLYFADKSIRMSEEEMPLSVLVQRPPLVISYKGSDFYPFSFGDILFKTLEEGVDAGVEETGLLWFERSAEEEVKYQRLDLKKKEKYSDCEEKRKIIKRNYADEVINCRFIGMMGHRERESKEKELSYFFDSRTNCVCSCFQRKDEDCKGFAVVFCGDIFSDSVIDRNARPGSNTNVDFTWNLFNSLVEGSEMSSRYPAVKAKTENAAVERQESPSEEYSKPPF